MDIANIASVNPTSIPTPTQTATTDKNVKVAPEQQSSTVVNISSEAKKLNETKSTASAAAPNAAPENNENKSQETAEAPGIQFMEGESKSGRVNTYA